MSLLWASKQQFPAGVLGFLHSQLWEAPPDPFIRTEPTSSEGEHDSVRSDVWCLNLDQFLTVVHGITPSERFFKVHLHFSPEPAK